MNDGSEAVPTPAAFKTRMAALDAQYQGVVEAATTVPLQHAATAELDSLKQAYWHLAAALHKTIHELRRDHGAEVDSLALSPRPKFGFTLRFWPFLRRKAEPAAEAAPPDPLAARIAAYEELKVQVHRKAMDIGDLCKLWRRRYKDLLEDEAWWAWDINVKVTLEDYGMCPVCTETIVEAADTCAGCGARLRYATSTVSNG